MTMSQIYCACNNMSEDDVFDISIVRPGLEFDEQKTYCGFYEIPSNYRNMNVLAFETGVTHYFVLSI